MIASACVPFFVKSFRSVKFFVLCLFVLSSAFSVLLIAPHLAEAGAQFVVAESAKSASFATTGTSTLSITTSAAATGRLLIAGYSLKNLQSLPPIVTASSGWVARTSACAPGSVACTYVFTKIATTSNEVVKFDIKNTTTNNSGLATIVEYNGALNTFVSSIASSSSGIVGLGTGSIVASATNDLMFAIFTVNNNTTYGAAPAGWTNPFSDKNSGQGALNIGYFENATTTLGTAYSVSPSVSGNGDAWSSIIFNYNSVDSGRADIALTNAVNVSTPGIGDTVTYSVTATNNGTSDATLVSVTDLLPSGMTYVSSTPSAGTTYTSGTGVWSIGNLNNGATATLTITATVNAGQGGQTITSAATRTASSPTDPTASNDTASASLVPDATAPTISPRTIVSNNASTTLAKTGDVVTVGFTANEAVRTPTVTIAGHSAAVATTSGNSFNATYTMASSDSEGLVPFTIAMSDVHGNAAFTTSTTTNGSSVRFDKTPPTYTSVSISSNNGSSTLAKIGNSITLAFTANEGVRVNTVTIATHGVTAATTTGNSFSATYTLVSGDTEGIVPFTISTTDSAGNVGFTTSTTTNSSAVTFDKTAPSAPGAPDLASADDTGSSNTDNITKNTSGLTMSGTAEAGSTVQLYDGAVAVGTPVVATGGNWSVDLSLAEGVHQIAAKATDTAGNTSATSSALSVTVDTTAPSNQNTVFPSFVTKSGGGTVTIISSGDSTNTVWFAPLGTTIFTANASTITAASGTATTIVAPTIAGNYKLYIIDAAGNISSASIAVLTIDNTAPFVSNVTVNPGTVADGSYTVGQVIPIKITFSKTVNVTGTPTLLVVTNSPPTTALNYASGTGSDTLTFNYTVVSGNSSADLDYASIGALALSGGTIRDTSGNDAVLTLPVPGTSGSLSANRDIAIDTSVPSVTLTTSASSLTNAAIPVTATFSEGVTGFGFSASDFTITNGSVTPSSFATTSSSVYTFTVTPTGDGVVTIQVPVSAAHDAAGNLSTISNTLSRTYDATAPTVVFAPVLADIRDQVANPQITNTTPVRFTATFTESGGSVSGFTASDISVSHGTAGNFQATADPLVYTFEVSPVGDPVLNVTVAVSMAGGKVSDSAGNGNTSTSGYTFIFDNHNPTVSLVASSQDFASSSPISVTATFSEDVSNFGADDVVVTGGSVTPSSFATTSDSVYTFSVTPTGQGAVTIQLVSGAAQDFATNSSNPSNTVRLTYDSISPTPTLSSSASASTNSSPIPVTATFGEGVSGFTSGDISVTGGSVTSGSFSTVSSTTYTFTITPTIEGAVGVSVGSAVATDAVGNNNLSSNTLNFIYDATKPVVTESSVIPSPSASSTPSYTFTSSEAGTISYGGSCKSSTTAALSGSNTVMLTASSGSAFSNGTYNNCTVTVTDAAGNASIVLVITAFTVDSTFVVDTTAPTLSTVSIASNRTPSSAANMGDVVTLSFTSSETINTPTVSFFSGSSPINGSITYNHSGNNWTASYTANSSDHEGLVSFTIDFSDIAGNNATQVVSTSDSSAVTFDKTAPSAPSTPALASADDTGASNSDGITTQTTGLTFTGTAEAGSTVQLYDGTSAVGTPAAATGGNWSIDLSLAAGVHSIKAKATDASGNISATSSARAITIDTTLPVVSGVSFSPTSGTLNQGGVIMVTITADATGYTAGTITINGVAATGFVDNGDNTYTVAYTVGSGDSDIAQTAQIPVSIVLSDTAGNRNAAFTTSPSAGATPAIVVHPDITPPVISNISVNPSANGATIRWTTDEAASSQVAYGLTSSYGSLSAEADTVSRVTSHTLLLSGLVSCSTYHYTASSTDASLNSGSDGDNSFTTQGCAGNSSVKSQGNYSISRSTGDHVSLVGTDATLSLTVPVSYGSNDAQFQIKELDKTTALNAIGAPNASVQAAGQVFDLHALLTVDTAQSLFSAPLTITLNYAPSDVANLDESTLKIYRNDSGVWTQLTNCSINTTAHTVTCDTDHFSTFSIFGQSVAQAPAPSNTASGSGGVVVGCTDPKAKNYSPLAYGKDTTACVYASVSTGTVYQFARTLQTGMSGEDVRQLQIFLNVHGFAVAKTGNGSRGHEVKTFGAATRATLTKFQEAHAQEILAPQGLSKGTGRLGATTMKVINALIAAGK